jgi:uncharacterized phosphosugar-binding protein
LEQASVTLPPKNGLSIGRRALMFENYLDIIVEKVNLMKETQKDAIYKAAQLVGDTLIQGHMVYTFGSGHSQLLAMEIHGRAGGLYPVQAILDPMKGKAEKLEGYGTILVEYAPYKAGDVLFVISNSGRNPEPIEVAMHALSKGVRVIVVTSLEHSRSVTSRHSSGKKLYELGEIVLDSLVPSGDASIAFPGLLPKSGALSTILGATILNAVTVEAVQYMLDHGYEPPVLMSANVDGSNDFNEKILRRYSYLPNLLDI